LYAPLSPLAFNTLNPRKTIMAAAAKDEDAPLTIFLRRRIRISVNLSTVIGKNRGDFMLRGKYISHISRTTYRRGYCGGLRFALSPPYLAVRQI